MAIVMNCPRQGKFPLITKSQGNSRIAVTKGLIFPNTGLGAIIDTGLVENISVATPQIIGPLISGSNRAFVVTIGSTTDNGPFLFSLEFVQGATNDILNFNYNRPMSFALSFFLTHATTSVILTMTNRPGTPSFDYNASYGPGEWIKDTSFVG